MVSQPNFSKPEYTSRNVFYTSGFGPPNCTWYVNGRMQELGYSKAALDTMLGNADTWITTAGNGCKVTNEPRKYSIAVWQDNVHGAGGLGHVAVVEEVNGGTILISESNWAGQLWDTRQISRTDPSHFIWVPGGPQNGPPGDPGLDNKDPIEKGCAGDAYTVSGGTAEIKDGDRVIGTVELRYSPKCQCNWTKVTSLVGPANLSATVRREDGMKCDYTRHDSSLYTNMVYAPTKKAQAIGSVNGHSAQTPLI